MKQLVAHVVLPLPLAQIYSYDASALEALEVGMRVIVPLGVKKFYTGIVYGIEQKERDVKLKPILSIVDDKPIVNRLQFKLWEWIASYYQCTLGEVLKAALPSGLKIESETFVTKNAFDDHHLLSAKEAEILSHIDKESVSVGDLAKRCELKQLLSHIKQLQQKGAITLSEELVPSYKARTETYVGIAQCYAEHLDKALDELQKTPKQLQLFSTLADMLTLGCEVSKKELLNTAKCSNAVFNELKRKGMILCYEKAISRLTHSTAQRPLYPLSAAQAQALDQINQAFEQQNTVLLHGVTSSGKTEVYTHLIAQTLERKQQVLLLVPEIALTTQLSERLKCVFGERIGIYHSRFSDADRVEIWQKQLSDTPYDIILGVRSSIFLPFKQLGLIIVDEEHDASYKQFDPAPRYNARDAAIVLASIHQGKTLLGTATPSIESYSNASIGKYALVELTTRYEGIALPNIELIDLKECYHRKQMCGHFSLQLIDKMREKLTNDEQIILFQNRRGFAPYTECKACAWVPRCPNCDVSLTYHKHFNKLTCHYCGHTEQMPTTCPECKQESIQTKGFGTEQVENEVKELFPDVPCLRMDLDTTTSRRAYEQIIADFASGKAKILIGTQIVTKGLDFAKVGLVAILNADNLMNYPDFRAHERAFQMLTQVSGRAGRKGKQGDVILQSSQPLHPIIQMAKSNSFTTFFAQQMVERQAFHYPPFHRLIVVELKHKDSHTLSSAAYQLAKQLQHESNMEVLGPSNPPVGRVQLLYIKHIMVKFENVRMANQIKATIQQHIARLREQEAYKQLRVNLNVDPM